MHTLLEGIFTFKSKTMWNAKLIYIYIMNTLVITFRTWTIWNVLLKSEAFHIKVLACPCLWDWIFLKQSKRHIPKLLNVYIDLVFKISIFHIKSLTYWPVHDNNLNYSFSLVQQTMSHVVHSICLDLIIKKWYVLCMS